MLDPQLTYHQYAEWAAAQRMLFLYRDGAYIPAPNVSFLEHARSDQFEPRDWLQHLGGVFPETRLKSFIERPQRRRRLRSNGRGAQRALDGIVLRPRIARYSA